MTEISPNKSTTIVELYAFLGYHSEYPPREVNSLRRAVDAFYTEYKAAGNTFFQNGSDSGPSTLCARSFLEEANRGSEFFKTEADAPSWPEDRDTIIHLLAFVFRRKEIASNKNDIKMKTKRKEESGLRASPSSGASDLRSEKVVPGTVGTAGMLALDPGYTLKPWGDFPRRLDPKSAREYLQSLDFEDHAEVVGDFTKTWLATAYARWPESADPFLHKYMHSYNFYLPELGGSPDIPETLLNHLIRGTELETMKSSVFKNRVWKRIEQLSSSFIQKSYIECEPDGTLRKTERFKTFWDNRNPHYQQEITPLHDDEQRSSKRRRAVLSGASADTEQESESADMLEEDPGPVLPSIETRMYISHSDEIPETPSVHGSAFGVNPPPSPGNDRSLSEDLTMVQPATSLPNWCCDDCGMSKMSCWCSEKPIGSVDPPCLEATETDFLSSVQSQAPEEDTGYRPSSYTLHSEPAQRPKPPIKPQKEPCMTISEHSELLAGPPNDRSYAKTASTKGLVTASRLNSSGQTHITKKRRLSLSIDYPTPLNGYQSSDYQLHFQGKKQFSRTSRNPPHSNDSRDPRRSRVMSPSSTDIPKSQDHPNSMILGGSTQKSDLPDIQLLLQSSESIVDSLPPGMPKLEHSLSATQPWDGVHQTKRKYSNTQEAGAGALPSTYLSSPSSNETTKSKPPQGPRSTEPPYNSSYALGRSPISLCKKVMEFEEPAGTPIHHSTDTTALLGNCNQTTVPETKVELFFEKANTPVDLNDPISAEKLWTLSLSDFFDFYASHSGILPSTFSALNFTMAFGYRQRLVVRRDASSAAWNKLRNRIRTFLELEKREKPDEMDFEIWVGKAATNSN